MKHNITKLLMVTSLGITMSLLTSCNMESLFPASSSKTNSTAVSNGGTTTSGTTTTSSAPSFADGLLGSAKDGSTYGASSPSIAPVSGSNYTIGTSKYNMEEVDVSSGEYDLPSTGVQNLLVIPVKISDYSRNATETVRNDIYDSFFGNHEDTGWESLASFYYKSSYKQLLLNGVVSEWYDCGYTARQLSKLTSSDTSYDPTWTVLENAVKWYKNKYNTDCKEFDNNGDGLIDGVWLVYSAPDAGQDSIVKSIDKNLFWAYTFSDYSVTNAYPSSPVPYHYCWASFDFMYEGYGKNSLDAHTFIHETGHLMGLQDYYVASRADNYANYDPMGAIDMMDNNIIDHNAYSKWVYGWMTPYVVTGSTTITLHPSSSTGECVILPTSKGWNGSAFDEYMMLEFYTPDVLNKKDSDNAYSNGYQGFTTNGVRIYHVDSRMIGGTVSNSQLTNVSYVNTLKTTNTYTTLVAHSNSSGYNYVNKEYRLIQELDATDKVNFDTDLYQYNKNYYAYSATNKSLFGDGDTFSYSAYSHSFPEYYYNKKSTMNNGGTLNYSVSFSNMSDSSVTLTITSLA